MEVELVEDADASQDRTPPHSRATRTQSPAWGRPIVGLGVACGVVAAVVAGLAAADALSRHAQTQHLTHAPGGVLSLDEPPAPAWTTSVDANAGLYFLPSLLVEQRPNELVALDDESGDQRWHVRIPADSTRCGVDDAARPAPDPVTSRLVCVHTQSDAKVSVVVVGASGLVQQRTVDVPPGRVWATADGGLVSIKLVGAAPKTPAVGRGADGTWTTDKVEHGYDALVHAEDASTGATRWDLRVPFQTEPAASASIMCFTRGDADNAKPAFNPNTLWVEQTARVLSVRGCGINAAISMDGKVFDESSFDESDDDHVSGPQFEPYADGGVLATANMDATRPAGGARSVLYDQDGTVVETFGHPLLNPLATDGTDSHVRLVGGDGTNLRAVERNGTVRWVATAQPVALLVRAADTAIVLDTAGSLTGLDMRTGHRLWSSNVVRPLIGGPTRAQDLVSEAFTDGKTALLVVADTDGIGTHLLALDLRTGDVRWQRSVDNSWLQLHAVQGHLVEQSATLTRTETSDNVVSTNATNARVRRLR